MADWSLTYTGFDPATQGLREALTTLGNGYLCTRGALPWARHQDEVHTPATYLAGGYNRARTRVADRWVENEDLVALPDWSAVAVRINGEPVDLAAAEVLEARQTLDIQGATLTHHQRLRLGPGPAAGRELTLEGTRLVSMDDPHLGLQTLSVTPHGWEGVFTLCGLLEGDIENRGVKRYRDLERRHLDVEETRFGCLEDDQGDPRGEAQALVVLTTRQGRLRIALAARMRPLAGGAEITLDGRAWATGAAQEITARVAADETFAVEKIAALYTARDRAISEPGLAAAEVVALASDGATLLGRHRAAWARLWDRMDLEVEVAGGAEDDVQGLIRLHLLHLLQSLSPHTVDLDVGVPARGWHGEAYRGHVFWDELMILPILETSLPDIAGAAIRYRLRRLPKARSEALAFGHAGAMFPWQSGSDGREESQRLHLNPQSGRWIADNTWLQRHVSLAVAWNAWRHGRLSGDHRFIADSAAPLLVEIARFFASLAHKNPATGRYEIHKVMGPDEFHDAFPGRPAEQGLRNNAYTNVLAAWLFHEARSVLASLGSEDHRAIVERLSVTDAELGLWEELSRQLTVPFLDGDIIAQFEGYETLKEFDWEGYRARYGDIHRLDRLLESEGDHANTYKVSKQADVLMLFYLLGREGVSAVLERLGYPPVSEDCWTRTIDYYLSRCSHGSTLSFVVHAWVMAESDPDRAWAYFRKALVSDATDIQGGTTREGLHLAAMAGSVDLMRRRFLGFEEVEEGVIAFTPCFLDRLRSVRTRFVYRGCRLDVALASGVLTVTAKENGVPLPDVRVRGERRRLAPGRPERFVLTAD